MSRIGVWPKAAVFAIELGSAFVADLKSCSGRIKTTVQHQAPRRLEPVLILKRTHCGQLTEVMVQRGHSQVSRVLPQAGARSECTGYIGNTFGLTDFQAVLTRASPDRSIRGLHHEYSVEEASYCAAQAPLQRRNRRRRAEAPGPKLKPTLTPNQLTGVARL
jgi:hypothetical protein